MHSRSERRLNQLEVLDQHLAVMGTEQQHFELLPADFAEPEWEALHAVVWRMNADNAVSSADLMALGAHELKLWQKACSLVHSGSLSPSNAERGPAGLGLVSDEGARPRFSPSQRRGRSPVLIVTAEQDDQLRTGRLTLPSYVLVLIGDNGRDHHAHLRREIEWLICRK